MMGNIKQDGYDIDTTLVLVCKRPIPGVGKQRLATGLGSEMAQQIANALLACALEDACNWPGAVVIAPANQEDVKWAQAVAAPIPSPVTILPQQPGNLGQRLNALDQTLRQQGETHLVFIGSDAPGLEAIDYKAARNALQKLDTMLIPAMDGGVVLMASRCAWPELSGLPWSSDQLGTALADACRAAGQSVLAVGQGYDVDEVSDFLRLATLLEWDERPARRALYDLACRVMAMMDIPHA
ncbi:MAG: DUF2064 domain-containing protein [Pseudomonadota bacterium]